MSRPFRRGAFSKIALVAAPPVLATAVTPEALQQIVAQLRGDSR